MLLDVDGQAKKDLSSHCDQIVMSLATLNKQRASEKQQPQSIKTTVTISKVSKTTTGTPIMSQSRKIPSDGVSEKSEPSVASSDSPRTVRAASKSSDEIPYADESIGKKKEEAKEKFMNEGAEMYRRGELMDVGLCKSDEFRSNSISIHIFPIPPHDIIVGKTSGREKHEKS